ncbi:MAG: hypothetical protein C0598_10615 [Marinilabiliales bacterium]|nr:MAG: hypothetical protein C0598_10615 [Marinilabiliales bacterium]
MADLNQLEKENKFLSERIKHLEEEIKNKDLIEKNLKKNESFYKFLLNQISIPYESLDPQGRIVEVNKAWLEAMGIDDKKSIIGKSITEYVHPDSLKVLEDNFPKLLKNGFVKNVEFHLLKKNGEDYYILNNGILDYKPNGEPNQTYCLFHDITDIKKKEKQLYDELELSKKLLNSTPNTIYIYDLVQKKNISINKRINDILGYSEKEVEEFGDKIIQQLMHPDDFKHYIEYIIPEYYKLKKDKFVEHKYRMRHKSGSYIWLLSKESIFKYDKDGNPLQVFGITEDVTEKTIIEKKLIESETKYRNLVERANDGICIIQDRKIVFANTKFINFWGDSKEKLIGLEFTKLLSEDEVDKVDESYKRRLAGEEIPPIYESVFKSSKGELIDIEINAGIIEFMGRDANLVLIHDIRNRKIAEKKIKEQLEDLIRSNKLMVSREHKMIELKQEINELRLMLGKQKKYNAPDKSQEYKNDML